MNRPPETIQVVCPECQATVSVPAASVGSMITCSDCLEDFIATPGVNPTGTTDSPRQPGPISPDHDDEALRRLLNPSLEASVEHETIRLEEDLSEDVYSAKKQPVLESDYEFSVVCVICGTRLDVNDSLIGKKIKCPDCHNAIEVRTPPPDRRRKPFHVEQADIDDDDFGLAQATDPLALSSPYHTIANELMAKAESEVARQTPAARRPHRDPVSDTLQRAEKALDEAGEQERPKLPAAPFRTGVLKFLLDPLTIGRLTVLALVLFVELGAIQAAIASAEGGATAQIVSVLFRMFAVTVGAVFATNLAVSLLGILQDTANGKDAIESWPDLNFLEWLGEAMFVFSGLFIVVFPACAVAKVLSLCGAPDSLFWLICIVGSSVGLLFLFPFALVSMLESASPIVPLSQPIARSLRLARGSWLVFTLLSGLLLGLVLGIGAVRVFWPHSAVMNFIVAFLLLVLLAVYFRLLGRLTWCCDEAVLAEDLRLEEAAAASENRAAPPRT